MSKLEQIEGALAALEPQASLDTDNFTLTYHPAFRTHLQDTMQT